MPSFFYPSLITASLQHCHCLHPPLLEHGAQELKAEGKSDEEIYAELRTLYNQTLLPTPSTTTDSDAAGGGGKTARDMDSSAAITHDAPPKTLTLAAAVPDVAPETTVPVTAPSAGEDGGGSTKVGVA